MARTRITGFTLNELMYVVLIIGILISIGLPRLLERYSSAQTVRVFPYAKASMEYLAGYHSIYGDWPNDIPNPMVQPASDHPSPMLSLINGQWPSTTSEFRNQPVWASGSVSTHDGSFLMTTNIIDRNQEHTVAFYLRPTLHDGLPTNFVWDCARTTNQFEDLPNPTTLNRKALPGFCRSDLQGTGDEPKR